ncbi:ATP-binding protein [Bacillus sp. FJAT-50079]|uniref:hybrid sensor histidine kinase/response regulator n=1 Tax=Bacillus sp. FJAT-50079 TaxID=2833577 RepID=UPI001BC9966D|nr:ATP-binding protein [Bacillus sp. FJAT-50079]MBS4210356.1 response regulator [Bacillus sp. FJAT-50079]
MSQLVVKHNRYVLVCIAILFILTLISHGSASAKQSAASKGFDFSNQLQSKDFYTNLDGEWHFFEKKLLTPDEVKSQWSDGMVEVVTLPESFQTHTGNINSFGTYSATIKIPEEYIEKALAIYIPYQYSAYTLFVDQNEISRNGIVGQDSSIHATEMSPRIGYFFAQSDEVLLTIQVSSFDHIRGGLENSIYFGEASTVSRKFNTNIIGTLFINGCIFIIGLFMVLFSLYRRQEQVFFIFGMFSMLISVRALFAVPFYYTLLFSDMSWLWGTRLEYILTEASSLFYVILLWHWHKEEFSKKVLYVLSIVHITLIVTTLFTQPVFFQALFFKVFYLAVPTFFYLIYVIYKSIRNQNRNAKINLIGMGIIFLAFFNDFAIGKNWYHSWTLMLPAVGVYVMLNVILMSKDFAERTQKTEQQNKQLLALNASNEELAIQLQKEIKRKDEFLANTSHELRNPLHGIINITQSILRNRSRQLDEKVQDGLTLQLTIGHHMSRTLEDLLDITRLKEHRIHLQLENIDVRAVSVGVIDMLKVLIENKNIQMEVNIISDFPHVVADKNRLIQILFNLLHNAVKYTDEGTITVTADIKDGMGHIHIADTGIGIDEKTLQIIFEPYEQGDSSITAIGGGLGLGLSICRQLVELHGGTMRASSVLGEGSVFTFTLPLAEGSTEKPIAAAAPLINISELPFKKIPSAMNSMIELSTENRVASYRPRILAIDDDPVNLRVLTNILSEDQYKVEVVTSGKEALGKLERNDWDLIISDVMMPNMSGYELTRSIREKFSISELPILLLTARGHTEDIYTGFLAGANDYVVKPVDAIELNARVHALTNLQVSINERLRMEAAWLQAQIRPHFLLNTLNAIVSLSEIDMSRMVQLLEKFSLYLQSSFYLKNIDNLVPLEYELELIESYLYIEKERFGNRLHVKWEIDEVENVMIPPLSIQTLVENAVNHGVLKRTNGGVIIIRIHKNDGYTEISVIDDGVGMDEEQIKQIFSIQSDQEKGIGLVNTEQRLKRSYGKGLHVKSTVNVGTSITFTVPNNSSSV